MLPRPPLKQQNRPKSDTPSLDDDGLSQANHIIKNLSIFQMPKIDMNQDIGIQSSSESTYSTEKYGKLEELPLLSSVTEDKFNDLMRRKLKQCKIICNFSNHLSDVKNRNIKMGYLQEILKCVSKPKYFKLFEPETFDVFFEMIKSNIIRSIPPIPPLAKVPMIGDDIKDTIYEATWPHLEIVYQIFQKFLESPLMNPQVFNQYFDKSFITNILALFDSPDQKERDSLKMILHKLYLRFLSKRIIIRQSISNILYTFIYETKYFCGISELLEIMISIVNGFIIPLKEEHKDFLINILLPLHTSYFLHLFHTNLFYCVLQYIQKDPDLIPIIVNKLLKLWPVSSSTKEILFINQLGRILEIMSEEQFVGLIHDGLFTQIGKSLSSNNFQVSETTLLLWKIDRFVQLITLHAKEIFPIICPYLYQTGTNHWNTGIRNLAVSVIRICMETSRSEFDKFSKSMKKIRKIEIQKIENQKKSWMVLIENASKSDKDIHFNQTSIDELKTAFSV